MCQTGYVNFADDWCLWSAPNPGATIGETEHEEVAWCTKPGRGTRLIPAGAITGLQFIKTKSYLQITGFIDQTKINLTPDDFGGELDPHGADFVSILYQNERNAETELHHSVVTLSVV